MATNAEKSIPEKLWLANAVVNINTQTYLQNFRSSNVHCTFFHFIQDSSLSLQCSSITNNMATVKVTGLGGLNVLSPSSQNVTVFGQYFCLFV